ncbi:ABC transporter ATP-binding protein [Corynebacterium anserum]|uniref:ABC transporter ATP-binding protein n=1 Tax=Corynebacterium anserum TaxID=2684406 RepID=UPI001FE9C307|nr:ATP-binding cassette domain-containing protein [Corynebacterium anserum]
MATTTTLKVNNVGQTFTTNTGQRVEALRNVTLDIPPGQIMTLVGPSGCGKSTLLKIIAGFFPPSHGTVSVLDSPAASPRRTGSNADLGSGSQFHREPKATMSLTEHIITEPGPDRGVVFQQPTLFPWLSVHDNVQLASEFVKDTELHDAQRNKATQLLDLVGLSNAAERYPHELSGGMQQRAQIARVLASIPKTVLMDEPSATSIRSLGNSYKLNCFVYGTRISQQLSSSPIPLKKPSSSATG